MALALLLSCAQPPGPAAPARPRLVGFLSQGAAERASDLEPFRRGLADLDYVEGQNLALEIRYAEGAVDRLGDLAAELVGRNVEVIVATSSPAIQAARQATSTLPIVMGVSADPVEQGFVASLAQPGGNVTGLTTISLQLAAKRVELLKEAVPGLSRLAVLWDVSNPVKLDELAECERAAGLLGLVVQSLPVSGPGDLTDAFEAASRDGAEGLIVLGGPLFQQNHARVVELTLHHRLPAMFESPQLAQSGGLIAYGPTNTDLFYRSATYVDKILRGAKPADLPVERPVRFRLVLNLRTADAIGMSIPTKLMRLADDAVY